MQGGCLESEHWTSELTPAPLPPPSVCLARGLGPPGCSRDRARGLCTLLLVTLCLQDLFKAFARHLSHSLAQEPSPGSSGEYLCHWARRHLGGSAGRSPAFTMLPPPIPDL